MTRQLSYCFDSEGIYLLFGNFIDVIRFFQKKEPSKLIESPFGGKLPVLQLMFSSSGNAGFMPICHRYYFLFFRIFLHIIRIDEKGTMHSQETVSFKEMFVKFQGMR